MSGRSLFVPKRRRFTFFVLFDRLRLVTLPPFGRRDLSRPPLSLAMVCDVDFSWRIVDGNGSLTGANEAQCHVNSTQVGLVVVEVTAAQDDLCSDQVEVKFLEDTGESDSDSGKGLPSYRLEPEHGKPWRSRYDAAGNEIIINSAHRDFLISKSSLAKHRRYVGKLYAKEVVLINFPHEAPAEVMERLIEITLRTEDAL